MAELMPDCLFWAFETPAQHHARCPLGDRCPSEIWPVAMEVWPVAMGVHHLLREHRINRSIPGVKLHVSYDLWDRFVDAIPGLPPLKLYGIEIEAVPHLERGSWQLVVGGAEQGPVKVPPPRSGRTDTNPPTSGE